MQQKAIFGNSEGFSKSKFRFNTEFKIFKKVPCGLLQNHLEGYTQVSPLQHLLRWNSGFESSEEWPEKICIITNF